MEEKKSLSSLRNTSRSSYDRFTWKLRSGRLPRAPALRPPLAKQKLRSYELLRHPGDCDDDGIDPGTSPLDAYAQHLSSAGAGIPLLLDTARCVGNRPRATIGRVELQLSLLGISGEAVSHPAGFRLLRGSPGLLAIPDSSRGGAVCGGETPASLESMERATDPYLALENDIDSSHQRRHQLLDNSGRLKHR